MIVSDLNQYDLTGRNSDYIRNEGLFNIPAEDGTNSAVVFPIPISEESSGIVTDLTGTNPIFVKEDLRFKVFKANQKINLGEAAYSSSIRVFLIENGEVVYELSRGSDTSATSKMWNDDQEDCDDVDAMSLAKVRYNALRPEDSGYFSRAKQTEDTAFVPGKIYYVRSDNEYVVATVTPGAAIPTNTTYYENIWDDRLVNCFYMQTQYEPAAEFEIAVTYRAFELEMTKLQRDGLGPEYSPGLMRSVIQKIDELYAVRNPVTKVMSSSTDNMHVLAEDLTGAKPENYITEVHTVNVPGNKYVIRPICGSFYRHGLSLRKVLTGTDGTVTYSALEEGVDFVVIGINKEKTAISEPVSGVYEYIVLKSSIVGDVIISYHAFGGEVSQHDINALKELVQNMYQTLASADIVTLGNLKNVEVIQQIIYRQELLEETVRHYQSQRFLYKPELVDKWVNIAFIEKHAWDTAAGIPVTCLGEFRFEMTELEHFMDVRLTYDIEETWGKGSNNQSIITGMTSKLNGDVCHSVVPVYEEDGLDYFQKRVLPKFRLLWMYTKDSDLNDVLSGVMLQMSMTSAYAFTNPITVVVTDRTGAKSPWVLIDTQSEIRPSAGKSDNLETTFPNGVVWSSTAGYKSPTVSMYPKGYTVCVGSVSISDFDVHAKYDPETGAEVRPADTPITLDTVITGTDITVNEITRIRVRLYDRVTGQFITATSQHVSHSAAVVNGLPKYAVSADIMYFLEDLCSVTIQLEWSKNSASSNAGTYVLKALAHTGTNSLNCERFDLVQIDVFND